MAYHGIRRLALVEPSTGSSTANSGLSSAPWLKPDSSLSTPSPALVRARTATSSATRSERYWPGLVPARPQSSRARSSPATSSAAAASTCNSSVVSTQGTVAWPITAGSSPTLACRMAVIDVAGYVAELKDHAVDHKFHVHDERHFVETYSLRQFWEVDLHPEEGCGGPIDLHLALEVEPRVLLDFEDAVVALPEDEDPPDKWFFPLTFNWGVPPLPKGPDLLRLAIDLAGVGGVELPLEISATDSFGSVTDAPVRRLTIVARQQVSLARVLAGEELLCDTFDRALAVTRFFLDNAPIWLGE